MPGTSVISAVKFSIITPSFNQAEFLPETLASVASQDYPNIEHIVVDPGSTDGSIEIASQASGISFIQEADRGQSDGICKGFSASTGEILAWLNSDDVYANSEVLRHVARRFQAPDRPDVIYGNVDFVDRNGRFLRPGYVYSRPKNMLKSLHYQVGILQPGLFFRREVFESIGGPSLEYEYCMDYEYWVRMARVGCRFAYVRRTLANHRWWSGMKTAVGRYESYMEHCRLCSENFGYVHAAWIHRCAEFLLSGRDGVIATSRSQSEDWRQSAKYGEIVRTLYIQHNGYSSALELLIQASDEGIRATRKDMERWVGLPLEQLLERDTNSLSDVLAQKLPLHHPVGGEVFGRRRQVSSRLTRFRWLLMDVFRAQLTMLRFTSRWLRFRFVQRMSTKR